MAMSLQINQCNNRIISIFCKISTQEANKYTCLVHKFHENHKVTLLTRFFFIKRTTYKYLEFANNSLRNSEITQISNEYGVLRRFTPTNIISLNYTTSLFIENTASH